MEYKYHDIKNESVDLEEIVNISKIENEKFEKQCRNSKLFGKDIYFSSHQLEGYTEDFWHMSSLENKDEKFKNTSRRYYNVKPCNNTPYVNKCVNCINHTFSVRLKNKSRDKCVYRMSTIEMFKIVIDKANNYGNEDNIKIWKVVDYTSRRTPETNLKIRFQQGMVDYLIILKETDKCYFFITAFSVFEHREKSILDQEYSAKSSEKIK